MFGFCSQMIAGWQHLLQPLAEQAPSSPSVTGCKLGPLYPQQHFPAFLFFWHHLEDRAPKPGETSEVISSISSLTKGASEAQTSVGFAAQDYRAAKSEPWHARGGKSTFSKDEHSSWVIKNYHKERLGFCPWLLEGNLYLGMSCLMGVSLSAWGL